VLRIAAAILAARKLALYDPGKARPSDDLRHSGRGFVGGGDIERDRPALAL
jgi:hypothetical protein